MNYFEYMASFLKTNGSGNSGGSTVDDGYCIKGGLPSEEQGVVNLSAYGAGILYKASSIVLDVERLLGSSVFIMSASGYQESTIIEDKIIAETNWAVVNYDGTVAVISGVAGSYNMFGMDFTIPYDGTYLFRNGDIHADLLYKPSPV